MRKRRTEWRDAERLVPPPMELARMGAHGRDWYDVAAGSIRRYALSRGLCPRTVAGVLAVTSPRVTVSRNVRITRAFLETGDVLPGTLGRSIAAARAFLETGKVSGPKVTAFYHALRGDRDAVVVDVWVARALNVGEDDDQGNRRGLSLARYRKAKHAVRSLAGRLGWSPAETQAALWVGACIAHGRNPEQLTFDGA